MSDHVIVVRPEASGAFDITVVPPPGWARFDAERPDRRSALRYAASLRVVHGWKVRDETGEAA